MFNINKIAFSWGQYKVLDPKVVNMISKLPKELKKRKMAVQELVDDNLLVPFQSVKNT